jgi:nicotinate-nucleotide adenylyltransferase
VRVGLLGGTFDPPHIGHLLAASDAVEQLQLDRLVFVPASQQPLKQTIVSAPAGHRLRMVELMTQGDRRFSIDEIEMHRTGLSFTVDTLEEYARRLPDSERFFLLGADSFATLEQWRDAARVVGLARLVVLTRATDDQMHEQGGSREDAVARRVRALGGDGALPPATLAVRRIDVSSTEIRDRVRRGLPIRGFVTEAVGQYIETNGLYR